VGLQNAESVKRDTDRRQKEHLDRMNSLDPSKSGRDSETVYRDAQGMFRDSDTFADIPNYKYHS
jgi:hypothetical protein